MTNFYRLLSSLSDWFFIIGLFVPLVAFIACRGVHRFSLAVSFSCSSLGLISFSSAISCYLHEGLHGSILVAVAVGAVLVVLPLIEPILFKRLTLETNRPQTSVRWIGPILALPAPILLPFAIICMAMFAGFLPLSFRPHPDKLTIMGTLIIEVLVLLLLHRASLMNKSESRPNRMRWICGFIAILQVHLFAGITLPLIIGYGNPKIWLISMSTVALIPIALFLMVLKRELVPEKSTKIS